MEAQLRTSITGPILAVVVLIAVVEAAGLLLDTIPVPIPLYLATLAASIGALAAHLAAWVVVLFHEHTAELTQAMEGRLDDYEVNGLNTLVTSRRCRHRRTPPRTATGATIHHIV